MNPLYPALISGFIGAIIGGLITLIATLMNQRHQQKLQQQRLDHESSTILASQRFKFLSELYNDFLEISSGVIIKSHYTEVSPEHINLLNINIQKIISFVIATSDPNLKKISENMDFIERNSSTFDEDVKKNFSTVLLLQRRFSELMAEASDATFNPPPSEK